MKSTKKRAAKKGLTDSPDAINEQYADDNPPFGLGAHHLFYGEHRPAFINAAINDALWRAAVALNMPDPTTPAGDEVDDFKHLVDLLNKAGDDFVLPPQPLIQYPPEIETRRADYKTLAEAFLTMLPLSTQRVPPGTLDLVPPGVLTPEHEPDILIGAIRDHIDGLLQSISFGLMYEPDFLRVIYVELRLYLDHEMRNMGAAGWKSIKERQDGND
jgi:hypothetical protein